MKKRKKAQPRSATSLADQKAISIARGKLVLIGLILIALIGCVNWIWHIVTDPDFLPVRHVTITGEYTHVDQQKLINTLKPLTTTGFFSIDMQAVTQTVSALPWVAQARVNRIWPSTLSVELVERKPVARWGKDQLLDEYAHIFTPESVSEFNTLPQLIGPEHLASLMWQRYQTMQDLLSSRQLQIAQVVVTNRRSWQITLTNGLTLMLGKRNILLRLGRFITVYPTAFAHKKHEQRTSI